MRQCPHDLSGCFAEFQTDGILEFQTDGIMLFEQRILSVVYICDAFMAQGQSSGLWIRVI